MLRKAYGEFLCHKKYLSNMKNYTVKYKLMKSDLYVCVKMWCMDREKRKGTSKYLTTPVIQNNTLLNLVWMNHVVLALS